MTILICTAQVSKLCENFRSYPAGMWHCGCLQKMLSALFLLQSALRCEIEKWKLNVKLGGYNVKTERETEMLQSHWLCANAATLAPMIGVFF
jgi:hypothetical protein